MPLIWKVLTYSTLFVNFFPALRFLKTKYFLFFLSTALLDLFTTLIIILFHIHSNIFYPYTFALMLLTLPAEGKKNIIIGTISLFLLYPVIKEQSWLPFTVSIVICLYMLNFFREKIFTELKISSAFFLFHAILFFDLLKDLVKIYFYYYNQKMLAIYSTAFFVIGIIDLLLITYAGSKKKIFIADYFKKIIKGNNSTAEPEINNETPTVKKIVLDELTSTEIKILLQFADGLSMKVIAEKLNRDRRTIYSHANSIKGKLNIKTTFELEKFAVENIEIIKKKYKDLEKAGRIK